MKKNMKHLFIALIAAASFTLNGCILDAFDTLTQELPYSVDISVSGSGTTFTNSTTVNLDDNEFYQDNKDKINKIELVKIAYKTKSVTPSNLTGTVTLVVKQTNGVILFSKSIPGNSPGDYFVNPYELSLSQAEIQLINAYLSILTNRTFTAEVNITTPNTEQKTLEAQIFAVFEMEYDL